MFIQTALPCGDVIRLHVSVASMLFNVAVPYFQNVISSTDILKKHTECVIVRGNVT